MSIPRSARICIFVLLGIMLAIVAIIGKPEKSHAEPLGSDIVCQVYTTLNALGSPIPTLDGGNCPPEDPPPAPPPPPPPPAACADGIDNDSDGVVDMADPGCSDASDADEVDPMPPPPPPPPARCADGQDNDGDEKVDAEDPGCSDSADDDETDTSEDEEETTPPAPSPSPEPSPSPAPSPAPAPTPSPSPTPSSGGGGGGSSGSGGGLPSGTTLYTSTSTGSVARGQVFGTSTMFSTTAESCERYLTAFIREGNENDPDQVRRLQRFLRDFEGAKVAENGVYDSATLTAVHAFQTKYASDILTPWGIGKSTGYVYLTTRKKVNEIYCKFTEAFYLTVEEQKKVDEARAAAATAQAGMTNPTHSIETVPAAPKSRAIPADAVATTTTTDKGQGVIDRSLRFLRGFLDRVR